MTVTEQPGCQRIVACGFVELHNRLTRPSDSREHSRTHTGLPAVASERFSEGWSEVRVQLGLDPGHPAAKEIFEQRDLGGVGVVSWWGLRPAPEIATCGVADLGGHTIDDAIEIVGREFAVQQRREARPIS